MRSGEGDVVYRNFSLLDNSFSHFIPFIAFLQWQTHYTTYLWQSFLFFALFATCLFGHKSNSDLRWQLRLLGNFSLAFGFKSFYVLIFISTFHLI